jgi:ketosteroid isomerase-like protein
MKKFLVLSLLALAMSLLAFGQKSNSKAVDEVMKLEDDWVKTRATKDPATTQSILADDYLGASPDGAAQTKQQFIDSVTAGRLASPSATYSDRNVRIYGDTAVSTGLVTGAGPNATDKIRYMRVYVKRNGRWQVVATQATPVTGG